MQQLKEANGFSRGQAVIMLCETSGDDHDGNYQTVPAGAAATIDSIRRYAGAQGVGFTLVIDTGKLNAGGDHLYIVNEFDEADGDPARFFRAAPVEEGTPVLFRRSRGKNPEITAVFPCEPWDGDNMTCYAQVGQHGACSILWYWRTRAATPEQYESLKKELEGAPFGYRLKVYSRIQPWMHAKRREAARKTG